MRHAPAALAEFASALFRAAGLDPDKADSIGRILVLTDSMGRRTHGLAQCGNYLAEIAKGGMTPDGAPEVLRDTGSTVVWDGGYRPGLWLMERALALGYTATIGEIYQAAGIRFDFSTEYLRSLADFVRTEMAQL